MPATGCSRSNAHAFCRLYKKGLSPPALGPGLTLESFGMERELVSMWRSVLFYLLPDRVRLRPDRTRVSALVAVTVAVIYPNAAAVCNPTILRHREAPRVS
jgi:hypothetical protein